MLPGREARLGRDGSPGHRRTEEQAIRRLSSSVFGGSGAPEELERDMRSLRRQGSFGEGLGVAGAASVVRLEGRLEKLEAPDQRLVDLEALVEVQVQAARDHVRSAIERERSQRAEADDALSEELRDVRESAGRLTQRVQGLGETRGAVEALEAGVTAEQEARALGHESLRRCVEELTVLVREKVARLDADLTEKDHALRDELARAAERAEQLAEKAQAAEERIREEIRVVMERDSEETWREAQRDALHELEVRLWAEVSRASAEHKALFEDHRDAHLTALETRGAQMRHEDPFSRQEQDMCSPSFRASSVGSSITTSDSLETKLKDDLTFQSFEFNLREELAKLTTETVSAHEVHREAMEAQLRQELVSFSESVQEQREALEVILERQATEHREVVETLNGRLDVKLEALDAKLQHDIHRCSEESRDGFERQALAALDAKLREQIDGNIERLSARHRKNLEEWDAKLKDEVDRLSCEHQQSYDELRSFVSGQGLEASEVSAADALKHSLHGENIEALEAKLREEIKELGAKTTVAMAALEAKLKGDVDRVARETQEGHGALRTVISDQSGEMHSVHDLKNAEHRQALQDLDAKLREEIDGKHGQLGAMQKAKFEALDLKLKDEIDRISSQQENGLKAHEMKHAEHKRAVEVLDMKLREEIEDKHGQLNTQHKARLQALDASLKSEVQSLRDDISALSARPKSEVDEKLSQRERRAVECQALEVLDARLAVELSSRCRIDASHRAALDALSTKFDEETARISGEQRKSFADLKCRAEEHKSDVESQQSRTAAAQRAALDEVDAKVEEVFRRCSRLESAQRVSAQTLGAELRDEIAKSQQANFSTTQRAAFGDVDARFRRELDGFISRLETQIRLSLESMEGLLSSEIERVSGEQQQKHAALADSCAHHREELDKQLERLATAHEEQCGALRETADGVEARLREAIDGALELDLTMLDLDGHEWTFASTGDYMEELARRLRMLQAEVSREQGAREGLGLRVTALADLLAELRAAEAPPLRRTQAAASSSPRGGPKPRDSPGAGDVAPARLAPQPVASTQVFSPKVSMLVPPLAVNPVRQYHTGSPPLQQYVPASAPWAPLLKEQRPPPHPRVAQQAVGASIRVASPGAVQALSAPQSPGLPSRTVRTPAAPFGGSTKSKQLQS